MTLKKTLSLVITFFTLTGVINAQSEAGAIFLLIAPGARAEGMGEAQVAVANDVYASYWNPAGLGFNKHTEGGLMHVKWLPNLADDMYYEFLAVSHYIPNLGTIGGHIIHLNLGEQMRTDELGNEEGTFFSYMTAATLSYGLQLSKNTAFGVNTKMIYQKLSDKPTVGEQGTGTSLSFGFDLGYLHRKLFFDRLDFGMMISNIGPKVAFIDVAQADPMPTNMKIGINLRLVDSEYNQLSFVTDINKLLVASYPAMDRNGDFIIDVDSNEEPYSDSWYIAIVTSWFDDVFYAGDIDFSGDNEIGGWTEDGYRQGGYDASGNELVGGDYDEDGIKVGWGEYGGFDENNTGVSDSEYPKEVGSKNSGSFQNEIDKMIFNVGFEYIYSGIFAIRGGYIYDKAGAISNPTAGFGLRYANIGFDFGYTSGKPGHPLTNTMRISLKYQF